jgi:hypothetical protein
MFADVVAALEGLGVSTTFICMRHDNIDSDFAIRTLQSLQRFDGPKFLFDFNGKTNLHVPHQGRQLSLLKEFKIPRLVQLIDHPVIHESYLRMDQYRTAWAVVARHHVPLARELVGGGPTTFLPHGGPGLPSPRPSVPSARAIELLFCGNIRGAVPLEDVTAQVGLSDPSLHRAVEAAVEAHIEAHIPLSTALIENFRRIGFPQDRVQFSRIYGAIDGWVVAEQRRAMLAALPADSKLVLCGTVPSDLRLPNATQVRGPITFADFLDLLGNARILLNSRTTFRDGAHERVFYGLSRGAAVITDSREYLAEDAAELPLGFFTHPGDLPDAIEQLHQRNAGRGPDRLDEEGACYLKRHSWRTRLEAALRFMVEQDVLQV